MVNYIASLPLKIGRLPQKKMRKYSSHVPFVQVLLLLVFWEGISAGHSNLGKKVVS